MSSTGKDKTPSPARHLGALALFLVLGVPMVAYLWETVHQILALHVDTRRALISLPVLAVFVVLLRFIARRLGTEE